MPDLHALGVELVFAHVPFAKTSREVSLKVCSPGEPAVSDEKPPSCSQSMLVGRLLLKQSVNQFPVLFVERMTNSRV